MAEEIDNYLLEKLKEWPKDQSLLSKIAHLHKDFTKLKEMLENPASPPKEIKEADWPKVRREKLYYLNNALTEWQMLSKNWGIYTPEAIAFAFSLSKKLRQIRKELEGGDGSRTPHVPHTKASTPKVSESYRWSSRFVDPNKVHGLDAEAMSLERMLVGRESGDSFKTIGIVGMAGIGKTTLAQLIFSQPKVKDYYLPRIWVCMSKQPNQDEDGNKEIVKRILRSLGIEEEIIKDIEKRCGLRGLMFALRVQLMDKRYLIVLDDLDKDYEKLDLGLLGQAEEVGEKLAYGLPKGCGGTIIVTSRHDKVAKKMVGEENLHTLVPLSDPESCWLIFKDWVEKDQTAFPPNLVNLKEEIVKRCGGLPLSAKMMGQIVNERLSATANRPVPQPEQTQMDKQVAEQPQTENQQQLGLPQMENQQLLEQLQIENQLPSEQPQTEKQQMERQELTEQQQQTEEVEEEETKEQPS